MKSYEKFLFVFFFWIGAFWLFYFLHFTDVVPTYNILSHVDFDLRKPFIGITIAAISFGIINGVQETWIFPWRLRRLPFFAIVLSKSLAITIWLNACVLIMFLGVGQFINQSHVADKIIDFFLSRGFIYATSYGLIVSLFINFIIEVSHKLGRGVLFRLITGKYHKPRREERIFMFLDLKSSTELAERLGELNYSAFLKEYYFDMSHTIEKYKGEVYQYVGDEVVVTWDPKKGLRDASCIRCFFGIYDIFNELAEKYEEKFGAVPVFKAGLHIGDVVTTELGMLKQEIVFHGDTVNTASRIQHECNRLETRFLISDALFERIDLDSGFGLRNYGSVSLPGKQEPVTLLGVVRSR